MYETNEPKVFEPAVEEPFPGLSVRFDDEISDEKPRAAPAPRRKYPLLRAFLMITTAGFLGLAIGITLAMLLASGDLDLSLKEVKLLFKSFTLSKL